MRRKRIALSNYRDELVAKYRLWVILGSFVSIAFAHFFIVWGIAYVAVGTEGWWKRLLLFMAIHTLSLFLPHFVRGDYPLVRTMDRTPKKEEVSAYRFAFFVSAFLGIQLVFACAAGVTLLVSLGWLLVHHHNTTLLPFSSTVITFFLAMVLAGCVDIWMANHSQGTGVRKKGEKHN